MIAVFITILEVIKEPEASLKVMGLVGKRIIMTTLVSTNLGYRTSSTREEYSYLW